jgi:hypothetical protein
MVKTCGSCGLLVSYSETKCEACGYQFGSDPRADTVISSKGSGFTGTIVIGVVFLVGLIVLALSTADKKEAREVVSAPRSSPSPMVSVPPKQSPVAQTPVARPTDSDQTKAVKQTTICSPTKDALGDVSRASNHGKEAFAAAIIATSSKILEPGTLFVVSDAGFMSTKILLTGSAEFCWVAAEFAR